MKKHILSVLACLLSIVSFLIELVKLLPTTGYRMSFVFTHILLIYSVWELTSISNNSWYA